MKKLGVVFLPLCLAIVAFSQASPSDPAAQDEQAPNSGSNMPMRANRRNGVAGTITAVNVDSVTLKTSRGDSVQVKLSEKTQFHRDHQSAKLADFKTGDFVFVQGQPAGDGIWQADMVGARQGAGDRHGLREGMGKNFIAGEIKSINGTSLVVMRPDGVTQTITVDESTSFKKEGESVTLADLKAGDHVFGRGEMKNDVFVPAVLNLGQPHGRMPSENNAPQPRNQ